MTSIEERVRKASRARAPTTMTRWMKDHEQPTSSLSWHKTCKLNHHLSQFIFHSSSLLVFLSLNLPLLHTRHAFMRSLQCCVTGHSRSHSIFRDAPNCCMQIVRFHAPLEITWRQEQKRTETEKKPVHVSVLLTSSVSEAEAIARGKRCERSATSAACSCLKATKSPRNSFDGFSSSPCPAVKTLWLDNTMKRLRSRSINTSINDRDTQLDIMRNFTIIIEVKVYDEYESTSERDFTWVLTLSFNI